MIEQLVAVLEQNFEDLTAEEIADILWLTLQQWQSTAATLSNTQPGLSSSEPPAFGQVLVWRRRSNLLVVPKNC